MGRVFCGSAFGNRAVGRFAATGRGLPCVAAILAVLFLSGCAFVERTLTGEPVECPRIGALKDAERLTRFASAGRTPSDVQFEVEIVNITAACKKGGRNRLDVSYDAKLVFGRGSAMGEDRRAAVELVVAHLGEGDAVLERFVLPVEIVFGPNVFRQEEVTAIEYSVSLPENRSYLRTRGVLAIAINEEDLRFNRQRGSSPR